MVRFFIDGREADMDLSEPVSVSLSEEWLTRLDEGGREGFRQRVKAPATRRNREIVGDAEEIAGGVFFNQQAHEARIEEDGCRLVEGALRLCGVERGPGGAWYRFEIVGPGKRWAVQTAERMLRELGIGFREVLGGETIAASWTWGQPVRFLPVQRRESMTENPEGSLVEPVRMLTVEDYHPFLHVRSLLERMMAEAGYRIVSDFFGSPLFDSLYLSGNYIVHDVGLLRGRMDFLAGRFRDAEAVTDRFGYVYAGQAASAYSLGALVETADPQEESEGATVDGVFDTGGCFSCEGGTALFRPPQEAVLGFEYRLRYTTDTWIASREELAGIDRVKLPGEEFRRFRIANRNADRREEYAAGFGYLLVVFGYAEGQRFRLTHDVGDPEAGTLRQEVAAEFAARSCAVGTYTDERLSNPVLWVEEEGAFVPYGGDWALYDGHVAERGRTEIELTVCSGPERLLPSQPKYFDRIVFAGPEPGMKMTLSRHTRLRPRFTAHPGEGSTVTFDIVAEHRVRQIRVIEAVQHLFNLRFYTDNRTRTVYIEPGRDFYRKDVVVDWSGKVDRGRGVEIAEMGEERHRVTTYCYQEGDGAVAQWNTEHGEVLGSWSAEISNRFALRGEGIERNPMATASVVADGVYAEAPGAGILQTGDRAARKAEGSVNFPAKFVCYLGMKELPQGQLWGWPGQGRGYPEVAFHRAEEEGREAVSLLFEDRDGAEGLHRFYDFDFRRCDRGRRVTVWLRLEPQDVEALLVPDRLMRDFRALFRLGIGGESGLFRLESVDGYVPGGGPTRCVFVREV